MVLEETPIWVPLPGPQTQAYTSSADVVFYGGSAGGGKTDLAIGCALTKHQVSIIYRKESTQLTGIIERMTQILGTRDGYNGQEKIWRIPQDNRRIEFGSCPHPGDEQKYQGRPHSLKVFDEITHFDELEFRFLGGWLRTEVEDEPQQILCTGNPPTSSDGEWVIKYWGPWLDENHPNPAQPGELRWFAMIDGIEKEVDGPAVVIDSRGREIKPKSRTFIPSSVEDNPYLLETGYRDTLAALPEPLRSQMLDGDFRAGLGDDPWQAIPSSWVQAAMDRWVDLPPSERGEMDSLGVDVARGGEDRTSVCPRYGGWFGRVETVPGSATPTGSAGAGFVIQHLKHRAPVHVDVIGVGASVYDHLEGNSIHTVPVNVSSSSHRRSKRGDLGFKNLRAELYWTMRECLDPDGDSWMALPPDPEIKADLCSARYKLTTSGIQVESKEEIKKRIGRSPDKGDAVLLANMVTFKQDQWDDEPDYSHDSRSESTGY